MLARAPRVLALIAVASVPYAVFHLLFQETVTIRYALPLVPLVALSRRRGRSLRPTRARRPS